MDFPFDGSIEVPIDIANVQWNRSLRLLVTAPHPDDFDAISVTLRRMVQAGHTLFAAVAQTGSGIDPIYGAGMNQQDRTALRNREQES
ncbi:MAG: PIG-L family deacetylase, partial [Oxalobacter sp.]|nr:PIG-L family deacetylase [Oxalobacter sp.]